jgi:hypothetical protein
MKGLASLTKLSGVVVLPPTVFAQQSYGAP